MTKHEFRNLNPDDYRIKDLKGEWFLQARTPFSTPGGVSYVRGVGENGDHFWENVWRLPGDFCQTSLGRELLFSLLVKVMNASRREGHYQGRRSMAADIGNLIKLGD